MFSAPKALIVLGLLFLLIVLPALTALAIGLSRREKARKEKGNG